MPNENQQMLFIQILHGVSFTYVYLVETAEQVEPLRKFYGEKNGGFN
jgi:hypothetical protein